ncbi:MAG: winged helix-turn-helix transcriptional regulator [Burkholderiales bacterium]|nr:winged helix-turn-helix transcriptional regulator [Opitutaceae bacterium]
MLAQHLGELVRDGFISRHENPRDRLDVSYQLTPLGRSLLPTLETLRAWADAQDMPSRATALLSAAG